MSDSPRGNNGVPEGQPPRPGNSTSPLGPHQMPPSPTEQPYAAPPPPGAGATAGGPVNKPFYKRTWFLIAAGVLALIILSGIVNGAKHGTGTTLGPAATPPPTSTSPQPDLAARVDKAISDGAPAGNKPSWALPITKIEDMPSGAVRVYYQEPSMTDCQAELVGRRIITFTEPDLGKELQTIVVKDANGIDHNVFRDRYKCSG